jgi:molybdopterin/thiamine biosynthesis adenylyltransferase
MRYARQEVLLGVRAQKALGKSLVTIVGCGGLGSVASEYLARAGVPLRLIDRDIVEFSNIHRQLFDEADVGKPKALQLRERLEYVNSDIKIDAINDDLNQGNIDKYLSGSSIVLDCTDNMLSRFLINDWCLKNRVPFIYSASIKAEGLFTLIVPKETPCLRCFIPLGSLGKLDTCETAGVLGPVVGMFGALAATEAMKYLTGKGTSMKCLLLHVNAFSNKHEIINIHPNEKCPACKGIYEFLEKPRLEVSRLCGNTFQYIFPEA